MSTLVIRKFADVGSASGTALATDWRASAQYFWPVLYNKAFAEQIGINTLAGASAADAKLRDIIAYSAIDEGTPVFGDTGIRALYDDANNLGKALAVPGVSASLATYATDISKAFVQYAGMLALNKVEMATNATAKNGVLTLSEAANNKTLTIDFTDTTWKAINGGILPAMPGRDALVNGLFYEIGNGGSSTFYARLKELWGVNTPAIVEKVIFATQDSGATILENGSVATGKANIFVGGIGNDVVTGSVGNELIYGDGGDDKFTLSGGKDFIDGGNGVDTLDMSTNTTGLRLASDAGVYTVGASPVLLAKLGHIEKYILGSGNDEIGIGNFAVSIDAGNGTDTVTDATGDWFVTGNTVIARGVTTFFNVEKFISYSQSTDFNIVGLGHSYGLAGAPTANAQYNYSTYTGKLNFNWASGTLAVIDQAGAFAGTDNIILTSSSITIGSSNGDTINGSPIGKFWLGKGNDIVNPSASNLSLVYTGGNDVVQSNGRYVALSFMPGIKPEDVTTERVNVNVLTVTTDGYKATYNYDLKVSVVGLGSILIKGNYARASSSDGIFGNADDQNLVGSYGPSIFLPDGSSNQTTPYGDNLTDNIYGGSGNDVIRLVNYTSTSGGEGNDHIYGGSNADSLSGGVGDDIIFGGVGGQLLSTNSYRPELLYGGEGNDILHGDSGQDVLWGGNGDDILIGGDDYDYLFGGDGSDVFYIKSGSGIDRIMDFQPGVDKISLGEFGLSNFSTLSFFEDHGIRRLDQPQNYYGEIVGDPFPYPDGFETRISFAGDVQGIYLHNVSGSQLTANDFVFTGPKPFNERPNIQNESVTILKDMQISLNPLSNDIDPEGGVLTLVSVGKPIFGSIIVNSNQTITYTPNAGFTGVDYVDYTLKNTAGFLNAGRVSFTVKATLDGTTSADSLNGSPLSDTIHGFAGNDNIFGHEGNDTLYGDEGNDNVRGEEGDDSLFGGIGNDIIDGGIGNDNLYGGDGDDTVYGDIGNDVIYGDIGNDSLYGGDGNDLIDGGIGEENIRGDLGDDTYVFRVGDSLSATPDYIMDFAGEGTDTIKLTGGVLSQNITIWTDANRWLHIKYSTTDEIIVTGYIRNGNTLTMGALAPEKIVFDDGTVI
ncbi:MAG: Ig-like domain-containing protein, partial [Alphaproteobacteria bacterium]